MVLTYTRLARRDARDWKRVDVGLASFGGGGWMKINDTLKRAGLILGTIGAIALLVTASSNPSTTADRATAGLIISVIAVIDLLALRLAPGGLRNAALYVAAAVQALAALGLAITLFLVGSVDWITSSVAALPGGSILTGGLMPYGLGVVALAVFVVVAGGLALSASRRDTGTLRDAVTLSIIGLDLIFPVVAFVVVFIVAQIFIGTQDPTVRDSALAAGAVVAALAGVGSLATLTLRLSRTARRDALITTGIILLGLIAVIMVAATGLLFYVGVAAAV